MTKEGTREIERIYFTDDEYIQAKPGIKLCLEYEFHGEYDMDWVLVINTETGEEIERHNVMKLATIRWKPTPATPERK